MLHVSVALLPMSHVEFNKWRCHMSLYFCKPCRMSLSLMSHVEFQEMAVLPCRFSGVEGHILGHHIYPSITSQSDLHRSMSYANTMQIPHSNFIQSRYARAFNSFPRATPATTQQIETKNKNYSACELYCDCQTKWRLTGPILRSRRQFSVIRLIVAAIIGPQTATPSSE